MPLLCHEVARADSASSPRASLDRALRRPSPTKDGKAIAVISIQSEREWVKLCSDVLKRPELPKDARFASNVPASPTDGNPTASWADVFAGLDEAELPRKAHRRRHRLRRRQRHGRARHAIRICAGSRWTRRMARRRARSAPIVMEEPRSYGRVPAIRRTAGLTSGKKPSRDRRRGPRHPPRGIRILPEDRLAARIAPEAEQRAQRLVLRVAHRPSSDRSW